ncbi:sigma-70 family RNA polymerase sigma factor [Aminipila terrae]|uniref:Sigma-70 family RNA polymerase sigma factor n=1 Tax=Aminipila terrae TaxID=2697030 RepID=A0A6P1MI18_9FIRM|nr:sigma-70 family RNA polymerase sigma factor [Aminipila terrae]QHI72823.1 sigma-70 family RNA polymerase sigma factor [Aminipila terrae]
MTVNEENFIEQILLKNEKALEFVIEKYGWIIKTVARKHLQKQLELTDECINDVLLAVWENVDSFDKSRNTFENWLAGVSRYKAIDCKRKYLKKYREEPLETLENVVDLKSRHGSEEQEISEELSEMLACLGKKDRGIFERLFWHGESVKSVSISMGMKETAVYNHVSRGRRKLRKHLSLMGKENNL